MTERLTAKRVEALLRLASLGEDWLVSTIQANLSETDAETQAQSREDDETIAEARIAYRVLHARWLAPKDQPHFTPEPDPTLPGFDDQTEG